MFRIFLVEDEINLNHILKSYLEKEDWEVTSFYNGKSALQSLGEHPHIWILDIMLPDIDGYELLHMIKADSPAIPVVFISARDADFDKIKGLEMGSDDYLAKPFLPRELVIRTHRLLERVYKPAGNYDCVIYLGPYALYEDQRTVQIGQKIVDLTSKEYELALLFGKHKGQALSREQIISNIWGNDYVGTDRSVDDLVRRLRKKMKDLRIETIYGFGYRMVGK